MDLELQPAGNDLEVKLQKIRQRMLGKAEGDLTVAEAMALASQ